MQVKTFALRDFSGGLNTAVAPTMLKPNESPDLSNVDIMDSRAITRRKGYVAVTSTPVASAPSTGFTRYYKADGTKCWLTAHGGALYGRQDGAHDIPLTRLEAENAVTAATPGFVVTSAEYSKGVGYLIPPSTTKTFAIPYSSSIAGMLYPTYPSLRPSTMTVAASLRTDSGSYASISAVPVTGYAYSASLTATHHTVTVKTADAIEHTIEDNYITRGGGYTVYTGQDTSHYPNGSFIYLNGTGGFVTFSFYGTRIKWYGPRKTSFGKASVVVDGADPITVDCYASTDAWQQLVWDSGALEYGLHRVFISYTGTKRTASTGYAVTVDQLKVTEGGIVVDYFDYLATSSFTTCSPAISASASNVAFVQAADSIYVGTAYNALRAYTGTSTTATLYDSPAWAAHTLYGIGDCMHVSASAWVAASAHLSATTFTSGEKALWTARAAPAPYAPKADFLAYLKTRVFAAHADSDLLEATALESSTDWTGGYAARLVGKDSGFGCTGLRVFESKVMWFSQSRMHSIDTTGDPSGWVNKTISAKYGCIAPHSLAEGENKIVFLSADGVRAYGYISGIASEDGSGIMWLSENITPTLDSIPTALRSKAAGAVYKGRYWLACALPTDAEPTPTANNTILVYKFAEKGNPACWTKYDNLHVGCMYVTRGDEYGLFATDSRNGNIYKLDTGDTDNGSVIPLRYKTPQIAAAGYEYIKHYPHIYISASSPAMQTITVKCVTGDVDSPTVTLTLTPSTDAVPVRANISARGRSIQHTVTSDGAEQPLTIDAITTAYNQPRLR